MRTERVNTSAMFDAEVAEVDVEKTQRDQTCTERRQQGEEMSLFLIIKNYDRLQELHTEAVNHSVTVMFI